MRRVGIKRTGFFRQKIREKECSPDRSETFQVFDSRQGAVLPIDRRRDDASGVARPFARREQTGYLRVREVAGSRGMRRGEEVRVSTPIRVASSV